MDIDADAQAAHSPIPQIHRLHRCQRQRYHMNFLASQGLLAHMDHYPIGKPQSSTNQLTLTEKGGARLPFAHPSPWSRCWPCPSQIVHRRPNIMIIPSARFKWVARPSLHTFGKSIRQTGHRIFRFGLIVTCCLDDLHAIIAIMSSRWILHFRQIFDVLHVRSYSANRSSKNTLVMSL